MEFFPAKQDGKGGLCLPTNHPPPNPFLAPLPAPTRGGKRIANDT